MDEFFPENLRNPARNRRAGLMRQFRSSQLDSSRYYIVYLDLLNLVYRTTIYILNLVLNLVVVEVLVVVASTT